MSAKAWRARNVNKTERQVMKQQGRQHVALNQHAPVFADKRTKRGRDKSTANRRAINDSREG